MHKHNLKEENYNFQIVIWSSILEMMFEGMAFIFNIIYVVIAIIGYILYIYSLLKRNSCAVILSPILFFMSLISPIFDIIIAFDTKKQLTYRDLSDFGELNNDIKNAYNSFIVSRTILKTSSIILLVSPLYYIISLFILVNYSLNKNKNDELKEQPIMSFNTNVDDTLRVKQVDNLYNE